MEKSFRILGSQQEAEAAAEAQRKAELARVKAAKQSDPTAGPQVDFLVNLQVLRIFNSDGWCVYLALERF